jgi:hypothetical protein
MTAARAHAVLAQPDKSLAKCGNAALIDVRVAELRALAAQTAVDFWQARGQRYLPTPACPTSGGSKWRCCASIIAGRDLEPVYRIAVPSEYPGLPDADPSNESATVKPKSQKRSRPSQAARSVKKGGVKV